MKKRLFSILTLLALSACFAFADGFKPTAEPVVLPAGTDGSYGTKGIYVLFGDWPQTVKDDDVTVSSDIEEVNGWDCYKGSDGCYYVKAESVLFGYYKFNNGESIRKREYYYFKLEPIKWRVVTDNYQGGNLLVAENTLINYCFYSKSNNRTVNGQIVYPNNYEYSTVRAYLNGLDGSGYNVEDFTGNGFINNAFTEEAIEKINTVTVDNSKESTGYSDNGFPCLTCENTEDKIFLLSVEEITKSSYGFDSVKVKDPARRRKTTDYSRATGGYSETDSSYMNNGSLWLRSPNDEGAGYACCVDFDGDADYRFGYINRTDTGVVPALSISF